MNLFQNLVQKLNNEILTPAVMTRFHFLSFDLYLLPINSSVYSVIVLTSKRSSGVKTLTLFVYFHLSIFHSRGCHTVITCTNVHNVPSGVGQLGVNCVST
jgi:hypothetical protein